MNVFEISGLGPIRWQRNSSLRGAIVDAPRKPGVYAFGARHQYGQLPLHFNWVYVGHSKSLSFRLGQHRPEQERNDGLRNWLALKIRPIEVWFVETDIRSARILERLLVRELRPEFNSVLYKQRKLENLS